MRGERGKLLSELMKTSLAEVYTVYVVHRPSEK